MINKTSGISFMEMTLQWGANQQINRVTKNCGKFFKGNKQRPLTERKGEGSALERAARESTIRGGDRSRNEQGQCLDVNFCFLKKKKSRGYVGGSVD